ncbi:kinase-like protein [Rickenella mellea]|uniref:Kinase-like protein n=1 Tax=Rickenella mellea TaxID=50990 RepID=A0A4Y7Q393_9AGAM|nr:kinase-like protein [Rickenella mellea]
MASTIHKDNNGTKKGLSRLMSFMTPTKPVEIETPNDPVNITDVGESSTGLIGLSSGQREMLLQSGISENEQEKNPQAVMGILKFIEGGSGIFKHENVWDKMAREDDNPDFQTSATPMPRRVPPPPRKAPLPPRKAQPPSQKAPTKPDAVTQPQPLPYRPVPIPSQTTSNATRSMPQRPKMAPAAPTAVIKAQPQPNPPATTPLQPTSNALDHPMSQRPKKVSTPPIVVVQPESEPNSPAPTPPPPVLSNAPNKSISQRPKIAPTAPSAVTLPQPQPQPQSFQLVPTPAQHLSNALDRSKPMEPQKVSAAPTAVMQPQPELDIPASTPPPPVLSNAPNNSISQRPKLVPNALTAVTEPQPQPQSQPSQPVLTPVQHPSYALDPSMSERPNKSPAADAEIERLNALSERTEKQQGPQGQTQSSVEQQQQPEKPNSDSSSSDLPFKNPVTVAKEAEQERPLSLSSPVALTRESEREPDRDRQQHERNQRREQHQNKYQQANRGEHERDPRDVAAAQLAAATAAAFDVHATQKIALTALNDREVKNKFLAMFQSDPKPVANLFQTLLDQDDLPSESRAHLARTLARLAKTSASYPDCLNLTMIRRTGTDPVAGGGFADVWKGYFDEKPVALKALRIFKQAVREKALKEFSHEAVIWRQLKHSNILPFYGVFRGDEHFDRLCLVSPWMDAGNVMDYLTVHPDSNRLSLLSDVAQGINYLHLFQPPIIHGDLKGANIFVSPSRTACVGDFGLARFRESHESTLATTTGNMTGTLRWQAPELLNIVEGESTRRSEQSDIYSFGCVCLELMTGKPPFSEIRNDGAVMLAISKGQIPHRPHENLNVIERGLDDTLWAFMQHCWTFDPALRPRIVQVTEYFQRHHDAARPGTVTIRQGVPVSSGQRDLPDPFVVDLSNLLTQLEGSEQFG